MKSESETGTQTSPPCPGRDAALFALLRRTGTVPNTGVRYGPGSAAHRFARATRCAASGARSARLYAAAAIDFRNPSISACRLVVESDNCLADDSSWLDAAPVWLAPWLTSAMEI